MNISAKVVNQKHEYTVTLNTAGHERSLNIPPKPEGFGSSVNGGELLFLALATCYCNDLYREAKKRNIVIEQLQVEVSGEFGGEGEGARNISYRAQSWPMRPKTRFWSSCGTQMRWPRFTTRYALQRQWR